MPSLMYSFALVARCGRGWSTSPCHGRICWLGHRNVFDATSKLWVKEGIAGFYCGYSSMVIAHSFDGCQILPKSFPLIVISNGVS